jgi:signal transduction histidine kinase
MANPARREDFIDDPALRHLTRTIFHSSDRIHKEISALLNGLDVPSLAEEEARELTRQYLTGLPELLGMVEILNRQLNSASITPQLSRFMATMRAAARIMLYNANRIFSPSFQRDSFLFAEDYKSLWLETYEPLSQRGISFSRGDPKHIRTKEDYIRNAVLPLVWNAVEHAFPAGTNHERKTIRVDGQQADPEASKGDYLVRVVDNGCGFEKGKSTKQDTTTQHGIGLWGVKQFVEQNGGRIGVDSKQGVGTLFGFSIPYSHKEGFICVQD